MVFRAVHSSHHLSGRPLPKSARFAAEHCKPCRDFVREKLDKDDSAGLLAASNLPPEDWRKFASRCTGSPSPPCGAAPSATRPTGNP